MEVFMNKFTNPLANIKIASPCASDWNEMIGNQRQRFCGACKLNVYNLSGMTQHEAENLIVQSEGHLCVRFYRRADGTVLTKDCPVGWQAIKRNVSKTVAAFASLIFTALSAIGLTKFFAESNAQSTVEALSRIENSKTATQEKPIALMGNFSVSNDREYTLSNGGMSNLPEIRTQIKNNRKR
jgi:hypothetical protein